MLEVTRLETLLEPNLRRVCFRPIDGFKPGRRTRIVARVMQFSEEEIERELKEIVEDFTGRHLALAPYLEWAGERESLLLCSDIEISKSRKMLIGACLTNEYALEAAALFNPSIVSHPNQTGVEPGDIRFILSLRAVGEGHISSIVFRSGIFTSDGQVKLDDSAQQSVIPKPVTNLRYERSLFGKKLATLGLYNSFSQKILQELGRQFTKEQLIRMVTLHLLSDRALGLNPEPVANGMISLAENNYEVMFHKGIDLSARVLFPSSRSEMKGMEDARFVKFSDPAMSKPRYIATYTAYDGNLVLPQITETEDFLKFKVSTLAGEQAIGKGMALFPKMINGRYAMLSRQDGETLSIMFSDELYFWDQRKPLLYPKYIWECIHIGNCGSPIETSEGWIVLTHGVGPMRRYSIGAALLDLEDPTKVIGRLTKPLISSLDDEWEGYVPNVVYTCGALRNKDTLLVPFGISDHRTGFSTVDINSLIKELKNGL